MTGRKPFVPAGRDADSGTLKGQLTKLGLHSMAAHCEVEADRAAKSETTYTAYLARLVELELADKADRSINPRIARARFPALRTLEAFNFSFQPGLAAARVRELANLAFLDQATNVLFVTTHLPSPTGDSDPKSRASIAHSTQIREIEQPFRCLNTGSGRRR